MCNFFTSVVDGEWEVDCGPVVIPVKWWPQNDKSGLIRYGRYKWLPLFLQMLTSKYFHKHCKVALDHGALQRDTKWLVACTSMMIFFFNSWFHLHNTFSCRGILWQYLFLLFLMVYAIKSSLNQKVMQGPQKCMLSACM